MKQFFSLIALAALAVGCSPKPSPPTQNPTQVPSTSAKLDEAKVLAIARQAVATNDTWVDRAEFQTPVRKPDGSWSIQVWRLPKVPGGHRLISVDEKGRVTMYARGK